MCISYRGVAQLLTSDNMDERRRGESIVASYKHSLRGHDEHSLYARYIRGELAEVEMEVARITRKRTAALTAPAPDKKELVPA